MGFYDEGQISIYTCSIAVPRERNPNIMTLGAYMGKLAHLPFLTSAERKSYSLMQANDSGGEWKDVFWFYFMGK